MLDTCPAMTISNEARGAETRSDAVSGQPRAIGDDADDCSRGHVNGRPGLSLTRSDTSNRCAGLQEPQALGACRWHGGR